MTIPQLSDIRPGDVRVLSTGGAELLEILSGHYNLQSIAMEDSVTSMILSTGEGSIYPELELAVMRQLAKTSDAVLFTAADDLEKIQKELNAARKVIVIPFQVDPHVQLYHASVFPDYEIYYKRKRVPCNEFSESMQILIDEHLYNTAKTLYTPIVHIGGDVLTHLVKRRKNVHSCVPMRDPFQQSACLAAARQLNELILPKGDGKVRKSGSATGYRCGVAAMCLDPSTCFVQGDFLLVNLMTCPMSADQICYSMIVHGSTVAYCAIPFVHEMIADGEGDIDGVYGKWIRDEHVIKFIYSGASHQNKTMAVRDFDSLLYTSTLTYGKFKFVFERFETSRRGLLFFKVARTEYSGDLSSILPHRLWIPDAKQFYQVKVPSLRNVWLDPFRNSNYDIVTYKVPKWLYDAVYDLAMRIPDGELTREDVVRAYLNRCERVIVNFSRVTVTALRPIKERMDVALAIFFKVFEDRYRVAATVAKLMTDFKKQREVAMSSWSLIYYWVVGYAAPTLRDLGVSAAVGTLHTTCVLPAALLHQLGEFVYAFTCGGEVTGEGWKTAKEPGRILNKLVELHDRLVKDNQLFYDVADLPEFIEVSDHVEVLERNLLSGASGGFNDWYPHPPANVFNVEGGLVEKIGDEFVEVKPRQFQPTRKGFSEEMQNILEAAAAERSAKMGGENDDDLNSNAVLCDDCQFGMCCEGSGDGCACVASETGECGLPSKQYTTPDLEDTGAGDDLEPSSSSLVDDSVTSDGVVGELMAESTTAGTYVPTDEQYLGIEAELFDAIHTPLMKGKEWCSDTVPHRRQINLKELAISTGLEVELPEIVTASLFRKAFDNVQLPGFPYETLQKVFLRLVTSGANLTKTLMIFDSTAATHTEVRSAAIGLRKDPKVTDFIDVSELSGRKVLDHGNVVIYARGSLRAIASPKVFPFFLSNRVVEYVDFNPLDEITVHPYTKDLLEKLARVNNPYPDRLRNFSRAEFVAPAVEEINPSYETERCADVVSTLQSAQDALFPGVSLQDMTLDASAAHYSSLDWRMEPIHMEIDLAKMRPLKPKLVRRSKLRTGIHFDKQQTLKETAFAIKERNLNVDYTASPQDFEKVRNEAFQRFLKLFGRRDEKKASLIKEFRENPIKYTEEALMYMQDSLTDSAVKKFSDDELDVYDNDVTLHDLMVKAQVKPKCTTDGPYKYQPSQTVVYNNKSVNSYVGAHIKQVYDRLNRLLGPNHLLYMRKSLADLEKHLTEYELYDGVVAYLENDFSKFDKSQQEICLFLEMEMYRLLGVDVDFIQNWYRTSEYSRIKSTTAGLKLFSVWQRKSGEGTTAMGNSIVNMLVLCCFYDIDPADLLYSVFMGDDSLLALRGYVPTLRTPVAMANVFNLDAKVVQSEHPYLFSSYIIKDSNRVYMLPCPLKALEKLGKPTADDEEKTKARWISFSEAMRNYKYGTVVDKLAEAVMHRTQKSSTEVRMLAVALNTAAQDYEQFKNIWKRDYERIHY